MIISRHSKWCNEWTFENPKKKDEETSSTQKWWLELKKFQRQEQLTGQRLTLFMKKRTNEFFVEQKVVGTNSTSRKKDMNKKQEWSILKEEDFLHNLLSLCSPNCGRVLRRTVESTLWSNRHPADSGHYFLPHRLPVQSQVASFQVFNVN